MQARIEDFIQAARSAGIRVSVPEVMEAYEALRLVGYHDRPTLKAALGATMAKTVTEKERFSHCFDQFFQHKAFMDETSQSLSDDQNNQSSADDQSSDEIGQEAADSGLVEMLLEGDAVGLSAKLQQAAQETGVSNMTFFTQKGVFLQRIIRKMGLDELDKRLSMAEYGPDADPEMAQKLKEARSFLFDQVRNHMGQQMALYGHSATEAMQEDILRYKPISEYDERDQERMEHMVRKMAQRLRQIHSRRRKIAARGQLDIRRTLRGNMSNAGYLIDLHWRRKHVERPQMVVICDVSRSVADYTALLLLFVYHLTSVMSKIHSFVFCSDVADVTDLFRTQAPEEAAEQARRAAPIGPTDYGQTLKTLEQRYLHVFTPKTTVVILGDARNNGLDPQLETFDLLSRRCRQIIWFNPETRANWDMGDSIVSQYEPLCLMVRECMNLQQLENGIEALLNAATAT